jgi:uncharacterized damage-inducible protein DinB
MVNVFCENYRLLARYNRWINQRLYDAAETLSDEERKRERGAFFGSIHRTLRSQATTLLTQASVDIGVTDLIALPWRVMGYAAGVGFETGCATGWRRGTEPGGVSA